MEMNSKKIEIGKKGGRSDDVEVAMRNEETMTIFSCGRLPGEIYPAIFQGTSMASKALKRARRWKVRKLINQWQK
jgi:hypothetical protein